MIKKDKIDTALKQLPFWQLLMEEQKLKIKAACYLKRFQAGSLIYSPVKDCLGLLIVMNGIIRSCLSSQDGKRATIFRLRENETCVLSMPCVLVSAAFEIEVEAEVDCELLIVPTAVFSELSSENVYVENFSYRIVMERFQSLLLAMRQLMFLSLEQRVVVFLLEESEAVKSEVLKLTQEQLAMGIGSAREAVARVLKELSAKGLVSLVRGKITLENKGKLKEMEK